MYQNVPDGSIVQNYSSFNFSNIFGAQVRNIISNLTKKNFKTSCLELKHIKELYGEEATSFILRTLVESLDLKEPKPQEKSKSPTSKDNAKLQLLAQEINELSAHSKFATHLLRAFQNINNISVSLISSLCELLHLSLAQELAVGLAFTQSPETSVQQKGTKFLKLKLDDIQQNSISYESLPEQLLHNLLFFMRTQEEGFSKQLTNVLKVLSLQKNQITPDTPLTLSSILGSTNGVDSKWNIDKERQNSNDRFTSLSKKIFDYCEPATLMEDFGYSVCSSETQLSKFFLQFPVITEGNMARILAMMLRKIGDPITVQDFEGKLIEKDSKGNLNEWNLDVFANVVKKLNLNWISVIRHFDFPGFEVLDENSFAYLLSIYSRVTPEPLPLQSIFTEWKEKDSQYSIMRCILQVPYEELKVSFSQTQQINLQESSHPPPSKPILSTVFSHCWNSLDLIECLLNLATPDRYEKVRTLFEFPIKHLPEMLLIGLAQVRENYINHLHQELTSAIIPIFLAMHANSAFVLHRVWNTNRNIIIKGLIDMYYSDKTTISRLLDIAQDLKALSPILESQSFTFVIDLAALASRREYLYLEKWLQDNIELHKEPFIKACIQYVKEKTQKTGGEKSAPLISPKVLSAFINCLLNIGSSVTQDIQDEIKQLKGGAEFKPHIEEKANEYFKKIYTSQLSIEEAINILKKFKSSKNPDELEIFGCMIHNLFDEYKFFQKYPDRELKITGILFGSLIQHQLVSQTTLRMALKYVLEALKKPVSSKMFKFGLLAIEQFDSRLAEWPTYCNQICYIPHLKLNYSELVTSIENRLSGNVNPQPLPVPILPPAPFVPTSEAKTNPMVPTNVPAVQPSLPVTSPIAPVKDAILRSSIPIDTLTEFQQEVYKPDSELQDKILFVFNNVSIQNIDTKVKELKTVLTENIYPWLAQYMVVQRASIEANFHSLYLSFLDKLQLQGFIKMCVKSTYHNVKLLLKSEKITTNQSERTLLKNLGSWLGNLTLAKNKPVLRRDLDLKELILEAYERGRLIAVVPFVARVLDASANSKIFLPPNVWTTALMQFLAEIYKIPRLKMNLKFEIELLCKTLHLDIKDVTPTNILKDYKQAPPPSPDIHEGNSPLVKKEKNSVIKLPEIKPSNPIAAPVPTVQTPLSPQPQRNITSPPLVPPSPPVKEAEQEDNPLRVQIYGAALFTHNPNLKKVIAPSIEKAIREIIGPVVERSATIACVSTRELILKDFANEYDDSKIKKAAISMVQNLAGNLALVTCKEPLRINITTHLMTALQGNEMPNVIEDVVQHLTNDNLDMACRIIEKATIEKATISLNESLSVALANRKKGEAPSFNLPRPLPDILRAGKNGLQPHQLRVYEEFAKAKVPIVQSPGPVPQIQSPTRIAPQSRFPEVPESILTQNQEKVLERLKILVGTIDEYTVRFPQLPLASIGDEGLIFRINQIRSLFTQPNAIEETSSFIVQQLFAHLYEIDGLLHRDVYCTLLEGIKASYHLTVEEITRCYLYLQDNRKLHKEITVRLFQSNLLLRKDFDEHFAELLGDNSKAEIIYDFLRYVMQRCIVELKISQTEFPRITEAIQKRLRPDDHAVAKADTKQDQMELRKITVVFFEEWVNIIVSDPNNQTRKAAFLSKIQQQWEEIPQKFFNSCTKIAISNFYRQSQRDTSEGIFITLDCYAKLIVFLWRYYFNDNVNQNVRLTFITKILMIIAKYLLKNCESKKMEFNQQPFHRLFNHLLNEMLAPLNATNPQAGDSILDSITPQLLPVFSAIFGSLSPCRVIGFSFSWLELISHRLFMSGLLLQKHPKGWQLFQRHLVELFTFLEPYLRNVELTEPIQILYRGSLRVLLVLLHDFPEFLCDYHYSFCDVIPVSCIQMRNLILSAFPRTMRLPEPFTPNLKVDLLPEINQAPRILSNYMANLGRLLPDLDTFLKTRNSAFLTDLRSRLLNSPQEAHVCGSKYNVPQLNALVMHVGMNAINQLQNKGANKGPLAHSPSMDLFQHLAVELDPEGRYLFLNAIVNQLRYPNNHTHYFSCVLLYIFAEAPQEIIQEQITRVLLERLIVNRPHPWGLLITFIELIKNPRYNFWSHNFTRCAPEVERLFESVARSCIIPNKPQNEEQTTAKQ